MVKQVYRLDSSSLSYQADIQQFHEELRSDGFVYVESNSEIEDMILLLNMAANRFFDLSIDEKMKYSYSLGIEERRKYRQAKFKERQSLFHRFRRGLERVSCVPSRQNLRNEDQVLSSSGNQVKPQMNGKWDPNPREYFDMQAATFRFCDSDFGHTVWKGLQLFNQIAARYLEQVLLPLNVDMDYVRSVAKLGPDSLTTLRLLKYYYQGETEKETCERHTDRGLITLAYCQSGGLTVKDFHSHQWIDVEASAPSRPCLILFTGETLSRLTGGYFKAILHKVVSKENRFSFPFFYRGRTPAVIDMTMLNSPVLNGLLSQGKLECLPPITVEQLDSITTRQYSSKSIPLELGEAKRDPYYAFTDDTYCPDKK